MDIFLIDFENVQASCFKGIEALKEDDEIYVFYSINCKIAVDTLLEIQNCKCRFYFKKINNGIRNALDFQLVEYLGYLIGKNKSRLDDMHFWIVSKDKGFESVIGNIEKADVKCCINVSKEVEAVKEITPHSPESSLKKELLKVMPQLKENKANIVIHCMKNTNSISALNNMMQKHIKDKTFKDGKEVGKIVKAIKPIYKQIKQ